MNPACTHVAIFARDIERATKFYCDYAALFEVHRRVADDVTVVWLAERDRQEEFIIVLIEAEHSNSVHPAPLAHLGYAVETREDVDRIAATAEAAGLKVEGPIDAGKIVGYYCIINDPDGNLVEFSHGQSIAAAIDAAD